MKFEEFEVVILLKDIPQEGLKKGDIGTVVAVFHKPEEAYEVEFVDQDGRTKSQVALLPNQLCKQYK